LNFKGLVRFFFDWWHKATFTTRLTTLMSGELVGQDDFGNKYFQKRQKKLKNTPYWERRPRWAIYSGITEASAIPPEWNAWLQHNLDEPPINISKNFKWEKNHLPNLTGTSAAYDPSQSFNTKDITVKSKIKDYEPWTPE